ncbi:imidazole glycerol phosphate synthase cyclase subunit [Pseudomonadales bacterium]|nr:imidazole glycerol phosphate synthase cyclase subunit [Pseudomonadales bacterium]
MNYRVIARLDIKGPNLVKGIHLEGLRVLGSPEDYAKYYYENGIDELIYQDVVASLFGRNSLKEIISRTASATFIPLTVGGGLRTVEDVRLVLRAGADKVSLNTAAIRKPQLIRDASLEFGSSTIVVAIEAIRHEDGRYFAYIDNGREETGVEVLSWAKKVEELGAGEILLTSVDRDGTGEGYDLELIKLVSSQVNIPVIAHGGAGRGTDLSKAIIAGADALAVASILHYDVVDKNRFSSETSMEEGNTVFLMTGARSNKISGATVNDIKASLKEHGYSCRVQTNDK